MSPSPRNARQLLLSLAYRSAINSGSILSCASWTSRRILDTPTLPTATACFSPTSTWLGHCLNSKIGSVRYGIESRLTVIRKFRRSSDDTRGRFLGSLEPFTSPCTTGRTHNRWRFCLPRNCWIPSCGTNLPICATLAHHHLSLLHDSKSRMPLFKLMAVRYETIMNKSPHRQSPYPPSHSEERNPL